MVPSLADFNDGLFAELGIHAILPIGDLYQLVVDKDVSLSSWRTRTT